MINVFVCACLISFALHPLQALCQRHGPEASKSDLYVQLKVGENSGTLRVTFTNKSAEPLAFDRSSSAFLIRLLDKRGEVLNDPHAFYRNLNRRPLAWTWVVLRPGERFETTLSVASQNGWIKTIPKSTARAILTLADWNSEPPEFVSTSKIRVVAELFAALDLDPDGDRRKGTMLLGTRTMSSVSNTKGR